MYIIYNYSKLNHYIKPIGNKGGVIPFTFENKGDIVPF